MVSTGKVDAVTACRGCRLAS